jgi:SAM-dependent methyltransferase
MGPRLPRPSDPARRVDRELDRWESTFRGPEFYYGEEPGPVARRAVRYHQAWFQPGATALDAGCGEGQDLGFLAERGYAAQGVEFTPSGAGKAREFLARRGLAGAVEQADLRDYLAAPGDSFDLVLAVNSLQFLGVDAPGVLDRLLSRVAPGGVVGLSLFGREPHEPETAGTIWFTTLADVLARLAGWQCLEAAKLWQWDTRSNRAQPFVTVIARRVPPAGPVTLNLG